MFVIFHNEKIQRDGDRRIERREERRVSSPARSTYKVPCQPGLVRSCLKTKLNLRGEGWRDGSENQSYVLSTKMPHNHLDSSCRGSNASGLHHPIHSTDAHVIKNNRDIAYVSKIWRIGIFLQVLIQYILVCCRISSSLEILALQVTLPFLLLLLQHRHSSGHAGMRSLKCLV